MARGFASLGSGTTDAITTTLTTHSVQRSYGIWFWEAGTGGTGVGRMWEKSTTTDRVATHATQGPSYIRDWSGATDGQWHANSKPTTSVWHHLLITYDGGSTANDPIFYIDGVSVAITEDAPPTGSLVTNANPYIIGNRSDGLRNWDGMLTRFAVWDRILTADEAWTIGKLGYPASAVWGRVEDVPMLRDNEGFSGKPTITGTLVEVESQHAARFRGRPRPVPHRTVAAGGFKAAFARGSNVVLAPGPASP